MVKQYGVLYQDTRRALLQTENVQDAGVLARMLVCHASGKSQAEFLADRDLYASEKVVQELGVEVAGFFQMSQKFLQFHALGMMGQWEFYGLPLHVTPDVLIPRDDTCAVADLAISQALFLDKDPRILDLCCGSGCIGLAIAANAPECRVLLGEISEGAIRVCRQNIRRNSMTGQVSVMGMDALQPPPRALGELQCIVSNPPYIPLSDMETLDHSVKDYEPHLALFGGEDGYDFYTAIIRHWKKALVVGGRLYFEVGVGQADTVLRMMRAEGFGDINIVPDGQGIPRVVYGTLLDGVF